MMDDGTDEGETRAARLDGWTVWETEERSGLCLARKINFVSATFFHISNLLFFSRRLIPCVLRTAHCEAATEGRELVSFVCELHVEGLKHCREIN